MPAAPGGSSEQADLVLVGGRVRTLDPYNTTATALAVRAGRVLAVGSEREMLSLAAPASRRIDLGGRTAVPGFIETHSHPYFFGLTLQAAVDAGSPPNDSIADIVDRVAQAVRDTADGEWIVGYRYDDTLLSDGRHPTRADLDPVSRDHPVLLVHVSGHFVTVNSLGMRLAGLTPASADPPGGTVVRDASGVPTGTLAESAAFAVYAMLPKRSDTEHAEVLGLAGDAYLAAGVTTVHDTGVGLLGGIEDIAAYERAVASGRLRTRVRGYLWDDLLSELGDGVPSPGDINVEAPPERLTIAGAKIISDGSIQGFTGCLSEPYTCAPDEHGMMLLAPEDLAQRVADLDRAGWQVAVHGNGDAAIQAIIDSYEAIGSPEAGAHRHRIEHCQTVREDQLDRMAENDVLASFFVKHVYYWGDRHRDRFLGPARASRLNPLASAHRRGLRFGLHADTPVTPVPPLEGIWCAVQRRTRAAHELGPDQRVDVETALRAYTSEAAYLGFEEEVKGTLQPGSVADIAVLSADPVTADPDTIRSITVDATMVDGGLAWRRDGVAMSELEGKRT